MKEMSNEEIISHANPHTIKKFELIEKYVEAWAHILLLNQYCNGLVFIDCILLYHYYQPLPVEVAGFERILTCSRERAKTVDLFPRTDNRHKNHTRPIPANVQN